MWFTAVSSGGTTWFMRMSRNRRVLSQQTLPLRSRSQNPWGWGMRDCGYPAAVVVCHIRALSLT